MNLLLETSVAWQKQIREKRRTENLDSDLLGNWWSKIDTEIKKAEVREVSYQMAEKIIKDYEGEVWCISKHLLAASMRLIEVGMKEQKKGNKKEAWEVFDKAFKLYSLFWAINLKVVDIGDVPMEDGNINFVGEKEVKLKGTSSPFDKLTQIFKKAIDCCKE